MGKSSRHRHGPRIGRAAGEGSIHERCQFVIYKSLDVMIAIVGTYVSPDLIGPFLVSGGLLNGYCDICARDAGVVYGFVDVSRGNPFHGNWGFFSDNGDVRTVAVEHVIFFVFKGRVDVYFGRHFD